MKIIQINTIQQEINDGGYKTTLLRFFGLGDDGMLYEWITSSCSWKLYGSKE